MTAMDTGAANIPSQHRPAYLLAGVAAMVTATAFLAWAVYNAFDVGPGTYLKALVSAGDTHTYSDVYHLAYGLVFAISGGLAFAGKRVARGALVVIAALTLHDSFTGLVGLTDGDYRRFFGEGTEGTLRILTNVLGLIATLVILVAVLLWARTPGAPRQPGYPPQGPPPGQWQQPGQYQQPNPYQQPFPQQQYPPPPQQGYGYPPQSQQPPGY